MNRMELSAGAAAALRRLEEQGFEAYAVGGCVRDALLGRVPHDWDLTTSALPEETAACFGDCRVIATGMRHGTVTVLLGGEALEITTYRRDGAYADNRHPVQVTFSQTLSDDLSRRDFTVNAMAYHPERGLVDLYGGLADLRARVIRCVGDPRTRFEEDGLRILRAVRFASALDFSIAEETAAQVHACRALLDNIARERVREELNRLLCGRRAAGILREFTDVALQIMPELAPCVGFAQNSRYHCYDVWEHTLRALDETSSPELLVRLTLLLHDVGKPATYTEDERGGHFRGHAEVGVQLAGQILQRLRYDNATQESVKKLVRMHDLPLSAEPRQVRRLMQKLTEHELQCLLEVARCDRLAHAPGYDVPSPALAEIPAVAERLRAEGACLSLRTLAVKGDDLLALGMRPGPQMGALLHALLEAVVDGRLPNEKSALLEAARSTPTEQPTRH